MLRRTITPYRKEPQMTKPDRLLERVIEAIVAVTRYPVEVLSPDADLENDLGIDSVKLVEILVALGKEFNLDLMKQDRDSSIRSIEDVAGWIESLLPEKSSDPAKINGNSEAHINGSSTGLNRPAKTDRQSGNYLSTRNERPLAVEHAPVSRIPTNRAPTPAKREVHPKRPNGDSRLHQTPHFVSSSSNRSQHLNGKQEDTPIADQVHSLRDRVALVTGSGRGVGRTIARLLAKKGATVIVNSFHSREAGERTAEDIIADGGRAIHIWGSVANPNHVDNMFDEISQRIGQLDILVCNASDGRIGAFTDVSAEDWERAFRTNVIGHYQCAMRASRLMQRQGGGAIITMSSIAAQKYVEGLGGQGVVKAAVESLTRHLACELSPFGIRTNCVSGGPVYGQVMSLYPEARSTMNYWETLVLDGELCSPLDLAQAVAFLASDDARGVNGAVWSVDHGLSTRSHSRPLPKAKNQEALTHVVS